MKPHIHLIEKRSKPLPHYELHFEGKVEFMRLDGVYLGESKVEPYSEQGSTQP